MNNVKYGVAVRPNVTTGQSQLNAATYYVSTSVLPPQNTTVDGTTAALTISSGVPSYVTTSTVPMAGTTYSSTSTVATSGTTYSSTSNVAEARSNPSEPAFEGTSASVYRVAALVKAGHSYRAIRRDYPMLSKSQIDSAAEFAARHPGPMDQYPTVILADALRNSGLDEVL